MNERRYISLKSCSKFLGLLLLLSFFSGCAFWRSSSEETYIKPFEPSNFSKKRPVPAYVQEVALLPIYWAEDGTVRFLDDLDQSLHSELAKTLAFELVSVPRDAVFKKFSFHQVDSSNEVPHEFIAWLKTHYEMDAIMFVDLSVYNPYKPVSIGFRCKLIDADTFDLLWAADNVFDSREVEVASGAVAFAQERSRRVFPLDTAETILLSPNSFAKYAAYMTFKPLTKTR